TCSVPSHTITAADAAAGTVRNTAIATGDVLGTVAISSARAHASVVVAATPRHHHGSHGGLPFTGFGPTRPLVSAGVAMVAVGLLLVVAAGVRRPRSD
ncbi:MAG TPA: hypothetical protein VME70_15395, partial [Mycobacteriales bacterium]|nr:hypothetical protein [Mycobacteriales bacterium]